MTGVTQERAGAPPPGDYTSWDDYMADVETDARHAAAWREDRVGLDVCKAMRLAPNLLVFRALLEGQDVPVDALDQRWRRRYGL